MTSEYNKIEKYFSTCLGRYPGLRKKIKFLYQAFNYYFYKTSQRFQTGFVIEKFSVNNFPSFFGYYDKSPVNITENLLAFHSIPNDRRNIVQICVFDFTNKSYSIAGETNAFNLQQGSRLQWLDKNRIIFNNFDNLSGQFISQIVNVKDFSSQKINFPIYDCSGTFSVSLNFDRLAWLNSDYGYFNLRNKNAIYNAYDTNDGIFYVDLNMGHSYLLISFKQIAENINHDTNFKNKVNHIMLSPDGKKFIFIYRWYNRKGKFDRLMLYDFELKEIKNFPDIDMVSHCNWINSNNIIGYMGDFEGGNNYYLLNINTGEKKIISDSLLSSMGDGHPSVFKNQMLSDNYPDRSRMKTLFIYDLANAKIKIAGKFFEPLLNDESKRCDLHPRWSPSGKFIYFDSVHEDKRFLYRLNYGKS